MMSTVGQVTDGAGMDAPRRPALRYHGAKWRLATWILSHFPALASYDVYAEPFGGSAAVLLRKERSPIEVFNDLDDDVVGFFRALRECPEALIRAIELTPFARREWERAVMNMRLFGRRAAAKWAIEAISAFSPSTGSGKTSTAS